MPLEQLGPYRITRLLGRGGMGAVYEGIHVETGEHSAVKILSIAFADDPSFRARFASEIETLKKLRHPNIVQLIGYGEQDGVLFYSMELVTGKNLHEQLQLGQRFDWRDVSEIAIQVCGALKHAHDHGVIHRDLKPANLLRAEDGTIKLTDFGIAKLFGNTQLTSAGGVIGTADYMSPEQAEGAAITPRSDLYSLGGVMYALLSGQPPFPGKSVTDVLNRMRRLEPPTLKSLDVNVPQELEDIILQLLHKDPQQRVATPVVLAKRLRAMLHALTGTAEPLEDVVDDDAEDDSGELPLPMTGEVIADRWNDAAWNQETVVTEPQPEPERPRPAAATNSGSGRPTNVSASTRYTSVNEELAGRRRDSDDDVNNHRSWARNASVIGLIAALLTLAGLAWFFMRPPSAEKLYERIRSQVVQSKRGDILKAREDIDQFLTLYPEDPRIEQVRTLRTDHEVNKLWKRLEREARKLGGIDYLQDVERDFVAAMREETKSVDSARQMHRTLIEKYGKRRDLSQVAQQCIDASRHVQRRLGEEII